MRPGADHVCRVLRGTAGICEAASAAHGVSTLANQVPANLATYSLCRMPAAQPGYYQPPGGYHSGPPAPAPYPYPPAPAAQYPPRPGMPVPFAGNPPAPPHYQTAPGNLPLPLVDPIYLSSHSHPAAALPALLRRQARLLPPGPRWPPLLPPDLRPRRCPPALPPVRRVSGRGADQTGLAVVGGTAESPDADGHADAGQRGGAVRAAGDQSEAPLGAGGA